MVLVGEGRISQLESASELGFRGERVVFPVPPCLEPGGDAGLGPGHTKAPSPDFTMRKIGVCPYHGHRQAVQMRLEWTA